MYYIDICLLTLVLVLSFICGQNPVKSDELLQDKLLRQSVGAKRIADIINIISQSTEHEIVEGKYNFTALGLRVSETKGRFRCGGGRPAIHGEFSHMGAVGWRSLEYSRHKWVYKCGASLISNKFLITAAHCSRIPRIDRSVYSHEPEVVKLGDKFINNEDDLDIESQIIRIDNFIKHPEYVSPRHYYDIALIELQESVDFGPLIRPACLWNSYDTSAVENVTVSGWGETSPFTGVTSDELQVGDVIIIDDSLCDSLLKRRHNRRWRGLSNHQLCAGLLSGRVDTCRGDSGGPLQVKVNISLQWPVYHLIGVTSFSYGCMYTNMPGIYIRISSFVDWIESIVWPDTM